MQPYERLDLTCDISTCSLFFLLKFGVCVCVVLHAARATNQTKQKLHVSICFRTLVNQATRDFFLRISMQAMSMSIHSTSLT